MYNRKFPFRQLTPLKLNTGIVLSRMESTLGGQFTLVSQDYIEQLEDEAIDANVLFNYCPDCNQAMMASGHNYDCAVCGYTLRIDGEIRDCVEDGVTNIKVAYGRKVHNLSSDYSKAQRKSILDLLINLNSQYQSPQIPRDVLTATANDYNEIQKLTLEETDDEGEVTVKKVVKRGNIKHEILGALLHYECIRANIARKKKDIAVFMQLQNNGFSRGEDFLRELHNKGKISHLNLPINTETKSSFVDRYLESLGIETDRNRDFILELVDKSIEMKIGLNSVMTSKVVGALWILIIKTGMKVEASSLQDKCDNIKKNTWMRFTNAVLENITKFVGVFERHGVPHGIKGKIVKRAAAE